MAKARKIGSLDLSKVLHLNPSLAMPAPAKKKSKYRNQRTEVDGIKFDSKKEAEYYGILKMRMKAGEISDLKLQVEFKLLSFSYIADFVYFENKSIKLEVVDVKSDMTRRLPVYRMKKKAMFNELGIEIKEV